MNQTVIETMKGVRISIDPQDSIAMLELINIRNLLKNIIEHEDTHPDVASSLRYARTHVIQAIRHQPLKEVSL